MHKLSHQKNFADHLILAAACLILGSLDFVRLSGNRIWAGDVKD